MPSRAALQASGGTHPGRVRDQNEDRLFADVQRGLFCVVDGVGGHAGGERAAEIALEMIRTRLGRETGTPAERLREGITLANNAVLDAARADPALTGMTCVLTAAIVAGDRVTIGHVGDTRCYHVRQGAIRKLTHDHSPVGEREDAGEITEGEAMRHPRRNEVYRDVGAERHAPDDPEFVEIVETAFERDGALLLCSDGLSDQVSSSSLRRIVETHAGDPAAAVAELIQAANDAGGKDNVSAVVVEGEGFAAAVIARGRASGSSSTTTTTRTGNHVAAAASSPAGKSVARPARTRGRVKWVAFVSGLLLGVALGGVAFWYVAPRLAFLTGAAPEEPVATSGSRTFEVGLSGDADVATIADALSRAAPGDAIQLAPGNYREAVRVRSAVTIIGPPSAVLSPPLGATQPWTAITVMGTSGVRVSGLTIAGANGEPLSVGVRIEGAAEAELTGVRISGAEQAAVVVAPGARAAILGADIQDNPGAGIVVGQGADVRVWHSAIFRNGHGGAKRRAGIELAASVTATLTANAIADNAGGAVVGWPADRLSELLRDNVLRPAPQAPARTSPRAAPGRSRQP